MKAENHKAQLEGDAYLMNPLQAFPLIRRLHSDWVHWQIYLESPVGSGMLKMGSSLLEDVVHPKPPLFFLFKECMNIKTGFYFISLCTQHNTLYSLYLEYVRQIAAERQNLPSEEEFNEAADAIFRLQDTYELIPLEMSIGILNGVHYDEYGKV